MASSAVSTGTPYASTVGGSWKDVNLASTGAVISMPRQVVYDPIRGQLVAVCVDSTGVTRYIEISTDNGASWSATSFSTIELGTANTGLYYFQAIDTYVILMGTGGTNAGAQWAYSTDGAATWTAGDSAYSSTDRFSTVAYNPTQNELIFSAFASVIPQFVDASSLSDALANKGSTTIACRHLTGVGSDRLWGASSGSSNVTACHSSDGGATWSTVSVATASLSGGSGTGFVVAGSVQIITGYDKVGTFNPVASRSTDGGVTWSSAITIATSAVSLTTPTSLVWVPELGQIWCGARTASTNKLWKSSDLGLTWTQGNFGSGAEWTTSLVGTSIAYTQPEIGFITVQQAQTDPPLSRLSPS